MLLNFKLWKDNLLILNEKIPSEKKETEIKFSLEQIEHRFDMEQKILERENEEFLFQLNLEKKTCLYQIKNPDAAFDILVDSLEYEQTDSGIKIEYLLETDDQKTTLEMHFLE